MTATASPMDIVEPTNGVQDLEVDIRNLILDSLSKDSQSKVKSIVKDVEQLSKFEKLMFYLELPSHQNASDPLRQPINPLGSRSEIQLTITWIRTHLEEDPQVSLPKHEVYDEYMEYCNCNNLKALSTADFGKVMKQVYPQVRPRRLGTRGNSRYCYAGLKKRVKLEEPSTPDIMAGGISDQVFSNPVSKMEDASTTLLLEWVEKLFNEKIRSIDELGLFLIEKRYVNNCSNAALTLLNSVKSENNAMAMDDDYGSKRVMQYVDSENGKRKQMPIMTSSMDLDECDTKRKRIDPSVQHQQQQGMEITNGSAAMDSSLLTSDELDFISSVKTDGTMDDIAKKEIEPEINSIFCEPMENETDPAKSDKLSQLRQLLEKNLKSPNNTNAMNSAFRLTGNVMDSTTTTKPHWTNNFGPSDSGMVNSTTTSTSLSQRRRVSFNPLVVHETHVGNSNVQPSPGTRKRHFSFQPISPRQNSLPQSPNASPFISPRSTPVPMLRSRHSSGSALPLHLLPQGPKHAFGSSSSDTSRAATFGSTSECSTPFISPHGTPIPFNRSRHNSAQGRLCRSRHSSGLTMYNRYNMTFSPMALNNLNNPYSPQPSTPLTVNAEEFVPVLPPPNDLTSRSRHSSAESEPPMRTIMMSPSGGQVGPLGTDLDIIQEARRQRHASAGQASANTTLINRDMWYPYTSTATVTSTHNNDDRLLDDMQPSSVAMDTLKDDTELPTIIPGQLFSPPAPPGDKDDKKDNSMQDDLEMTLSALKDCDNDFSKFVQETENGK